MAEFDILYGVGISREGSLIDLGVEQGIVRKAGAWYTYEGDQLGQGKENARTFLKENPDTANEIEKKIKEKLGVGPRLDADPNAPTAAASGVPAAGAANGRPAGGRRCDRRSRRQGRHRGGPVTGRCGCWPDPGCGYRPDSERERQRRHGRCRLGGNHPVPRTPGAPSGRREPRGPEGTQGAPDAPWASEALEAQRRLRRPKAPWRPSGRRGPKAS